MATRVTGRSAVTKEFLQALGLEDSGVTKLVFTFETNSLVIIEATLNAEKAGVDGLLKEIKKYKLVEIEDGEE